MANNRSICGETVGRMAFNVSVFNGENESVRGQCAIYVSCRSGGTSAEVRAYGYADDLRRVGQAFLAAADEAEKEVQA